MAEIVKCKKCKGQPPRRGNPPCATCKGYKFVEITTDGNGNKTIRPAVQ